MKVVGTVVNLLLLAGASLILIFIVLSGSVNSFPFKNFYWIKADTSAISGAYGESAWTFWGVCDKSNYSDCHTGPAYPIVPQDNFGSSTGVPRDFLDNRSTYYYLSRFAFAFFIVALVFVVLAFIVDILGFCFTVIDKVVIALVTVGLLAISAAAAFQTAVNVLARNAFQNDGHSAHVGVKLLALVWAAFACTLLVFFNTCAANIATSYRKHIDRVRANQLGEQYYAPQEEAHPEDQTGALGDESSFTRAAPAEEKETSSGGIRFFRIKRNQKATDDESV